MYEIECIFYIFVIWIPPGPFLLQTCDDSSENSVLTSLADESAQAVNTILSPQTGLHDGSEVTSLSQTSFRPHFTTAS